MTAVKKIINTLFTKYLLLTNIGTSGMMLSLGDIICQKMENVYKSEQKKHNWNRTGRMFVVGLVLGPPNHYWYLLLDKFLIGTARRTIAKKILADQLIAAPIIGTSFLYGMGLMEGSSLKKCSHEWREKFPTIYVMPMNALLITVVANMAERIHLVHSCATATCFSLIPVLTLTSVLDRQLKGNQCALVALLNKVDWVVWPPAQFFNFTYLPTKYRVAYVSFFTLLWDTVLSYIKHWESMTPPGELEEEIPR